MEFSNLEIKNTIYGSPRRQSRDAGKAGNLHQEPKKYIEESFIIRREVSGEEF